LSYSQFEELETFARFGTRLDDDTRQTIERGQRVREVLKQPEYRPIPVTEQIAVLLAVSTGIFDDIDLDQIPEAERLVRQAAVDELPEVAQRISSGEKLSDEDQEALLRVSREAVWKRFMAEEDADA
jgi:F-type H+/Na+-transporting ATPase subunit alpha